MRAAPLILVLIGQVALAGGLYAGPEPVTRDGKDAKVIATVAPPACDWTGFYIGANAGGQFGHSEDKDLDDYNFPDKPWGYGESGFTGGGQIGYNWQWRCLVLGPEIDGGYLSLHGRGIEPGFPHDTFGQSDSDFFATFRGRLGVAAGCWLFYGTGGAIGVNYHTRVSDSSFTRAGPDTLDASREEFDWGYTFGGGVERMFHLWGRRWSFKVEYLYFTLDHQNFSNTSDNFFGPFGWEAETHGHIVRGGLNFHF